MSGREWLSVAVAVGVVVLTGWVVEAVVKRHRRAKNVYGEFESLLHKSGALEMRRNPCNEEGCLIRLGTRCGDCGVTLYDCEISGGCKRCGSVELSRDEPFPVCDVCSYMADGPVRHAPPVCEPLAVER